ncbi:MAG: glycoside hydrolase family 3 protein [Chloroflexi bacterium]|uniref:glycoside hydrolase family 3 protein n=1 Tax=Candidatus Flexifilum breve TaxID=3140694 RepID=UPI0031368537|nr:glycoside hydrolase family 3 protein [Chloroflexota bacterium]
MNKQVRLFVFLLNLCALLLLTTSVLAQDELYRDPTQPIETRVEDLLARMTLAEKIGQMTLVEKNSLNPQAVFDYFIGGVLSGGGGYPNPNTPEAWLQMVTAFQDAALDTRLGIPIIYGVDAVHGHNNVRGATIFPHNIGLGAARNAELVEQIGAATAAELMATGIYWNYAPVLAPVQDIRWGRTYESFGENTELVTDLGLAFMNGLQGDPLMVLATPKHYLGDGGTTWGTSSFGPNNMDRGDTQVDEATLRELYLPPYIEAVDSGALTLMVSFSSWNGVPMHAHEYLITDVLKGELGFTGFVVSDWQGIDLVNADYYQAVVASINAGVDMNMVPQDYRRFITTLTRAVEAGDVPQERIDDAVRRILRAKFAVGLFDRVTGDGAALDVVGSAEHRALARQAVSESLVLLKNEDALPLAADATTIFVAGSAADDIGIQSGGWTIEWQGGMGDITIGTTILEGITAVAGTDTHIAFERLGRFESIHDAAGNPAMADYGIVIVGEEPYAEWEGDNAYLALSRGDRTTIERVREQSEKLIVIVVSGRPLVITEPLNLADAVVAAWLPGTEGAGVADVLFGAVPFTGTLPFTWLRSADQLPFDFANLPTEGCDAPLFPYGYGLTYENNTSEWLDLAVECAAS